ncbi:MAG TPA: alpha/beta fold hydrolase [Acidimicrobiales bacterium]
MNEPTYILVHGAWGGAWCWRDVGLELTNRGVQWTALDLPSSTHGAHSNTYLADDANDVIEVASLEGPVVLVGHSYGGAVITEAADRVANLQRLVYIAALVPTLGQSASEANQELPVRTMLDDAIEIDGDFLRLNSDLAAKAMYQDCTDEVTAWAVSQLTAQSIASLRSPREGFDVDVHSHYVLCTNDNAIDPSIQQVMSQRCSEVAMLESGHTPLLSQPSVLCDLILTNN